MSSVGESHYYSVFFVTFFVSGLMWLADAELMAPSLAASPAPMNDATAIDQGIGYVLMHVLVVSSFGAKRERGIGGYLSTSASCHDILWGGHVLPVLVREPPPPRRRREYLEPDPRVAIDDAAKVKFGVELGERGHPEEEGDITVLIEATVGDSRPLLGSGKVADIYI
ncbi:hypothetical protein Taro_020091 [Colocasia esculenta]|uniref:Uncharacterized protein n=1 Tax=Colocasia esculenta TaxID=4460 RepID=A0A843UYL4_COLES|nr:hypothetical protein [Colocasia esculenta]